MSIKRTLLLSSLLVCALACRKTVNEEPLPQVEGPGVETQDSPSSISGSVDVQFSDALADYLCSQLGDRGEGASLTGAFADTRAGGLDAVMSELGISSIERIFPDAGEWEARHRAAGLHKFFRITYADSVTHTRAAAALEELPGVVSVDVPHSIVSRAIPFNDPYASYQWHYYNDGTLKNGFVKGVDINVVPVWEQYTAGSKDVIVCVVDSGVDAAHPDLSGVVIPDGEDGSRSFFEDGDITTTPGRHGTHVAGTIAAINNNGIGVCGIAGGDDGTGGVRILSAQMLDESNDTRRSRSFDAIVWGADHGAVISQNSWGYVYESETDARNTPTPEAFKAAVTYFTENAGFDKDGKQTGPMAGGIVIFAAGNDAWAYDPLSGYEKVLSVGAIAPNGKASYYTNYGDWVDICAPGGDKYVADPEGRILSTAQGSYVWLQGTSMACPHVSGVAALVVSHFGGPGFTCAQLWDKLLLGADWNARSASSQIGPKLDAYGAFTAGEGEAPVITTDYTGDYTLRSHESLSVTYNITSKLSIPVSVSFEANSSAITYRMGDERTLVMSVNALEAKPGTYRATITAKHTDRLSSVKNIEITILENHAPVIVGQIPSMVVEDMAPVTIDMTDYITDADGEYLTYDFLPSAVNVANFSVSRNTLTITPKAYGTTDVVITASDARGKGVEMPSFRFVVYDSSVGFSAWPVPVTDVLRLHSGTEKEMEVVITTANGREVYRSMVKGSAFSPAKIDLSSVAAGRLELSVSFSGKTFSRNIVKR